MKTTLHSVKTSLYIVWLAHPWTIEKWIGNAYASVLLGPFYGLKPTKCDSSKYDIIKRPTSGSLSLKPVIHSYMYMTFVYLIQGVIHDL